MNGRPVRRFGHPLRLRVHVPGFDAVCRVVQADMGLGVVPERVFGLIGGAMQLAAVPLRDLWAASLLVAHLMQAADA